MKTLKNIFLLFMTIIMPLSLSAGCDITPVDPVCPGDPECPPLPCEGDDCPCEGPDCDTPEPPTPDPIGNSVIEIPTYPSSIERYPNAKLYVGEWEIPMLNVKTNTSHRWTDLPATPQRADNAVVVLKLKGVATFTLITTYELDGKIRIFPSDYNIRGEVDQANKTIKFEIYAPGQYTIEPNEDPKNTIHLFVDNPETANVTLDKNDPNVIYFGPGIHNRENSDRIDNSRNITPQNGQTVWLDYGAVVEGRIYASGKNNIKVVGGGLIYHVNISRSSTVQAMNFSNCNNISISGITVVDPAAWVINLYFCNDIKIDNIKIIGSRQNSDGITVQSCQRLLCENSFVRGYDDNLVVKNYPTNSNNVTSTNQGHTEDITFRNMVLWTDLAQSMEIGYELVGDEAKGIVFENINVFHNFHKPVISIHNCGNSLVHDVIFKDITVEVATMGMGDSDAGYLIDFVARYHNEYSSKQNKNIQLPINNIEDVLVQNVLVKKNPNGMKPMQFLGAKDTRPDFKDQEAWVKNITLTDVQQEKTLITASSSLIMKNEYVSNLVVNSTGKAVTGYKVSTIYTSNQIKDFRLSLGVIYL